MKSFENKASAIKKQSYHNSAIHDHLLIQRAEQKKTIFPLQKKVCWIC